LADTKGLFSDGVLGEDEVLPRSGVDGEAQRVLELALNLHLEAAVLPVAHLGVNLEASVGQRGFLQAHAGDGLLKVGVHAHELLLQFRVKLGRVLRGERPGFRLTARVEQRQGREAEAGEQDAFHRV